MGYLHPEIELAQSPKREGRPCGDVATWHRTRAGTILIVADGLGSGISANLDATLFVSWLRQHLDDGTSLRGAVSSVVRTLRDARHADVPFAALSLARIRPDGGTVVLGYEAPPPILISDRCATVPRHHTLKLSTETVRESHCHLHVGDGLMLLSDGVTQAGLGADMPRGWTIEGVRKRVHHRAQAGRDFAEIARGVHDHAREISTAGHDDTTVLMAACREGTVVNILTGPPADSERDADVVRRFFQAPGRRIVCGGTTAEIVARETGEELQMEQKLTSDISPPRADIDGVDLVTEGSISLNQVYNILDEEPDKVEDDSGVSDLYRHLREADRVNFTVGGAQNPATGDISFRQRGILTREKIVPLLVDKLRAAGKLVVVRWV